MKYLLIILLTIVPIIQSPAQEMRRHEIQRMHRIEQLERIKLIEEINLTEEQSVRFFSRRKEHRKEIENIEKRIDETLSEIDKILNSGDIKESTLKKLVEDVLTNREKIETKRKQFILSLNDILSTEQISKLILFERRFRDEIREMIIKRKLPHR